MESRAAVIGDDGVVLDLVELDADQALEYLNHALRQERRAESHQLQISAHRADPHTGDALQHNPSTGSRKEHPNVPADKPTRDHRRSTSR